MLDNLNFDNCVDLLNMADFFDTASCLRNPVLDFVSRYVRVFIEIFFCGEKGGNIDKHINHWYFFWQSWSMHKYQYTSFLQCWQCTVFIQKLGGRNALKMSCELWAFRFVALISIHDWLIIRRLIIFFKEYSKYHRKEFQMPSERFSHLDSLTGATRSWRWNDSLSSISKCDNNIQIVVKYKMWREGNV